MFDSIALDRVEQIVDEREQLRHRSEVSRNRPPRLLAGPKTVDETAGMAEQRDIGVAEGIDGLFDVADDEDAGREPAFAGEPGAFAPRANELMDQPPLRTARILKLVDEHVLVPRLEQIAAAGELVHLIEERQRPIDELGKVEHAMPLERPAILGARNLKRPRHATREHEVQIEPEALDDVHDYRCDADASCRRDASRPPAIDSRQPCTP